MLRPAAVPVAVCALALAVARPARARFVVEPDFAPPTFELDGAPPGGRGLPDAAPAHLAGSTIAALADGALAIDGDSGELVRVGAGGGVTARLAIGPDAAQLVVAGDRAYVTDRRGDAVVVVELAAKKLVEKARWETPVEPWGIALSPDGKTLLVTTIADRTLVAIDAASGKPRWQRPLSREPRGVAITPDGATALVAYLGTGTVERIATDGEHEGVHVALGGRGSLGRGGFDTRPRTGFVAEDVAARPFARSAFAVRALGHGVAVVGFQESVPVQVSGEAFRENTGSYGGGFEPPVTHRLAFLDGDGSVVARVITHQPNAIGWDAGTDRLAVAGYGSDDLLVIDHASQTSIALRSHVSLAAEGACGPDGVAVTADTAYVWCSLSRRVAKVALADGKVTLGKAATTSRRSALEQKGLALFRAGNDARISTRGAMACTSCHPDARADGLSWRIEGNEMQTPLLAGRVAGTHPYKWDGGDKDLATSLSSTMRRLGGVGLPDDEVKALTAYLESLPAPRAPARDRAQVARGKKLFASDELGCAGCHGGKRLTDRERHELDGDLAKVDTPSLIGVAASAPYYHDGSAATLDALLRDTARVHGMAEMEELTDQQIADLVAYLETL